MPRDGPSLCVYSLLPLCAAWVMGSQFSGRVGESVELPCRAEGATEGRKGVSWTQVVDGEEKSLLSAHVDVGGMSHRRFTLAQSSVLHLLIHNVSVGDDGLYVCVDGNGTRQATWLSVMNRTDFEHSEGMGTSWTCEGLEMQRGNGKQRAAHHMRMARLISSFFRRNRNQEYQVDSGKGSGYPECNHRVSIVTTSGATWYENVGSLDSRGAAEQEDPTVGDDSFEEDKSTLSYENLYADNEQDSDDYLNPESDNGSEPSEDYMVPISDPELPETTEAQIHYATEYMNPELDAGSVHTDAQIHSAADTEVYEPMAGQIDSWQDRHSNGNDEDYEKMESSDYCNVHEVEMSEEDRRRMERCRAVFMNRLHLSSPHNTLADVVIALRNPR